MIGPDSDSILRYFLKNDQAQTGRVHSLFKQARQSAEPLFVSTIVLCEVVWVLSYQHLSAKPEILKALRKLLDAQGCRYTATFDRALRSSPAFLVL